MMERQESDQTFGNKDYIRYATLFHYYGHHYKSTVEMFLGSGLCNRALRTSYSLEILRMNHTDCIITIGDCWELVG